MQLRNVWVTTGAIALLVGTQGAFAVDSNNNGVDDALTVSVAAAGDQSFPETDLPATPTASVIDFDSFRTVRYEEATDINGSTWFSGGSSVSLPCGGAAHSFVWAFSPSDSPRIRVPDTGESRDVTSVTDNCSWDPDSGTYSGELQIFWDWMNNMGAGNFPVVLSQAGTSCDPSPLQDGVTQIQAAHVTTGVLRDVGTGSGVLDCYPANVFGGAGGSGDHPTMRDWTLTLNETHRYISFWWSAGNDDNNVQLLDENGNNLLSPQFRTNGLYSTLFGSTSARCPQNPLSGYCGNPNLTIGGVTYSERQIQGEPYAFLHLRFPDGFRQVRFWGTGFEMDNLTLSVTVPDLGSEEEVVGALPAYSLTAARVIPVDPRSQSVSFPGILLGGAASSEPNATLCLSQVTDSSGSTLVTADSSNVRISAPATTGITQNTSSPPRFTFTGSQTTLRNFASQIRIVSSTSNRSVASSDSVWLRASVQAQLNGGDLTCSQSNSVVTAFMIELRPIRLNNVNRIRIPID